ncbi:MAG: LuxR C-terminal-related transcriptional regulator [Suipraeoptans sp.]
MINSKEYLPKIKKHIPRPRIDNLYKKGLNTPLTTVISGPGYGKTTSCTSFVSSLDAYVLWYNVSELYNDVNYFWSVVKNVITSALGEISEEFKNMRFPDTIEKFEFFYDCLLQTKDASKKVIIVYDNYELLNNKTIIHFVSQCIKLRGFNTNIEAHHILLCNERLSNYKNPFFEDYKTPGEYNRINDEDLVFNFEEIEKCFALGLNPTNLYNTSDLLGKTGGWPVFISMLSEGQSMNKTYLILFELFENHFFGNYSFEMQLALIKCSMFKTFTLGLIREILIDCPDQLLTELTSNVFIRYNFSTQIFTFQEVYYIFLNNKLVVLSDDEKIKYYNLAGKWYFDNKEYDLSMQQYMAAKNYEGVLSSVSYTQLSNNSLVNSENLQSFFLSTPSVIKNNNPWVEFYLAYTYINCDQINLAQIKFKELLNVEEHKKEPINRLLAEIHRLLADISILKNKVDGLDHIKKAAKLMSNKAPFLAQDVSTVDENDVFFIPEDNSMNVKEVVAYITEFTEIREKVCKSCNYGFEHLFQASAAYYGGNMKKGKIASKLAISKSLLAKQYDIAIQSHYLLSLIYIFERDYENLMKQVDLINSYFHGDSACQYTQLRDILLCNIYLQLDDNDKIASWIKENDFEAYEEQPLKKGRNYFSGALYNMHIGEYSKANEMLYHMEPLFEQRGLWILRFYFNLVQSIFFYNERQNDLALQCFAKAYAMIYPNNLYVALVETGAQALPVISLARSSKNYDFDMDWLKEVETKARIQVECRQYIRTVYQNNKKKITSHNFNLTKKEKTVLNLLSQGYTRNEIAENLEISINGVKKFINNIYIKLGAKNRAEAIFIASQNHIL